MSDKQLKSNMPSVPIWKKMNLTVEEASEYSGIGTSKIKELSNSEDCPFVLWNGAKRLIKRKQFEGAACSAAFESSNTVNIFIRNTLGSISCISSSAEGSRI